MHVPLRKLAITSGLAAVLLAEMSVPSAQAAKNTAPGKNLSRWVATLANSNRADKFEVIVIYKNRPGRSEQNRVDALGGKTKRSFKKLKMRTLRVSARRLKALATNPNIHQSITLNQQVSAL